MPQIEVKGLDALIKKFDGLANDFQEELQLELNQFADKVAKDAKNFAPADEGKLRQSISAEYGQGNVTIKASARYAAYVEFGTRKFASDYVSTLPDTWQQLANEFKGKSTIGGGFKEFMESIMAWAKRKGIDDDKAYAIAKKIMIYGSKPHPFLYPAVNNNIDDLIKNIKNIIE
jgi:HK97 gp10 family phage protein